MDRFFHGFSSLACFQDGIPFLAYHKMGRAPAAAKRRALYLGGDLFGRQLGELRSQGFLSLLPDDIVTKRDLEKGQVLLSFDDGYQSVHRIGLPVLRQNGYRAIVYLVAGKSGGTNDWDTGDGEPAEKLMNDDEVKDWIGAGNSIGCHTYSHVDLTRANDGELKEELRASRLSLEDRFGSPVRHFCYPYGAWDERVRNAVSDAGYATAATMDFGIVHPGQDLLNLKRITARYRSDISGAVEGRVHRWWKKIITRPE